GGAHAAPPSRDGLRGPLPGRNRGLARRRPRRRRGISGRMRTRRTAQVTPDAWTGLARHFRDASHQFPMLRHLLINLPEPDEPLSDTGDDQERMARLALWDRLQPAFRAIASILSGGRLTPIVQFLRWHDLGQEQVFYGDPDGVDAPSWQRCVEL